MRSTLAAILFCLPLAACGGKSTPKTVDNTTTDTTVDEAVDERSQDYGGEYGGEEYGDDYYGSEEPYVPPPPTPPDLVGSWKTPCAAGMAKGEWMSMSVVATADHFDYMVESFGDAACTKKKLSVHFGGAYTVASEMSTAVADAWNVDFTIETRELTAADKKTAKAIGKTCGIKKLKAGKAVDISAKGCAKLNIKPAADCPGHFDLVSQMGSRLYFGAGSAETDGCTAETRATAVDSTMAFSYQWPPTGIAECDAYLANFEKFLACDAMPVDARNQAFSGMKMGASAWNQVPPEAQQATSDACKQANDAFASAMQGMNCTP